jgi:hypothetical protein
MGKTEPSDGAVTAVVEGMSHLLHSEVRSEVRLLRLGRTPAI